MNTLVFSPNEKLLAIGTQDAWIKVRDPVSVDALTPPPPPPPLTAVCAQVVDPLTGFSVCETDVEAEVMCVAFHPFEEFLAASTSNGKVRHRGDPTKRLYLLLRVTHSVTWRTLGSRFLFLRSSSSCLE